MIGALRVKGPLVKALVQLTKPEHMAKEPLVKAHGRHVLGLVSNMCVI